jgi:hypothetical protein
MSIIGQLKIDGTYSVNKNDKVAAFVNGQCRGVAQNLYVEAYDKYIVFLTVYSNVEAGENVNFKIWNAAEGYIHTNVTPIVQFVYNDIVGTLPSPQTLESFNSYSFAQNLNQGWTWISFNLFSSGLSDVNQVLESISAQNGNQIKSQKYFANYSTNLGWDGSLVHGGGFNNTDMYMVKLSNSNVLKYSGSKLNAETIQIPLNTGWNWIGYTPNNNMYLNDALAFANPAQNDIVKSQYQFAMYDQKLGWVGNLTYFVPGLGYMYKTSKPSSSFTYPSSGLKSNGFTSERSSAKGTPWSLSENDYQFNMSAVAALKVPSEIELSSNNYLGVFYGSTCRGIAEPIEVGKDKLYFVTIYGESADNLSFKVVDMDKNLIYDIVESVTFAKDEVIGNMSTPLELNLKPYATNVDGLTVAPLSVVAYPNPFKASITIEYKLAKTENLLIELFDIAGRRVSTVQSEKALEGIHTLNIDGSQLSAGTYLLKFVCESYTKQLVVVKL